MVSSMIPIGVASLGENEGGKNLRWTYVTFGFFLLVEDVGMVRKQNLHSKKAGEYIIWGNLVCNLWW